MFTAIMIIGVAGMVLALVALVLVSIAVQQEDRRSTHADTAPNRVAGATRHLTGLHIR